MRRVLFFCGLALALFSCTSGSNNTDTPASDTSTTMTTDGTNVAGSSGVTDTSAMNMGGTDTGVGRTTMSGNDTASTGRPVGRSNMKDSL